MTALVAVRVAVGRT